MINNFFNIQYCYLFVPDVIKKRSLIWAKERQYFDGLINKSIREGLGSIKEVILIQESHFCKKACLLS